MKTRSMLLLIMALFLMFSCKMIKSDPFVTNGIVTNDYPAIVRIDIPNSACSAGVISHNTLLTAAHCLTEVPGQKASNVRVKLDNGKTVQAIKFAYHKKYNMSSITTSSSYDIGVIVFPDNTFSGIDPLTVSKSVPKPNTEIRLVGYGCFTQLSGTANMAGRSSMSGMNMDMSGMDGMNTGGMPGMGSGFIVLPGGILVPIDGMAMGGMPMPGMDMGMGGMDMGMGGMDVGMGGMDMGMGGYGGQQIQCDMSKGLVKRTGKTKTSARSSCAQNMIEVTQKKTVVDSQIKNPTGNDASTNQGDSGGPILLESDHTKIVGITSYGDNSYHDNRTSCFSSPIYTENEKFLKLAKDNIGAVIPWLQ